MTITHSLPTLLAHLNLAKVPDLSITGLCLDSRAVQAGDAFIALPGTDGRHGMDYAEQAIQNGAAIILADAADNFIDQISAGAKSIPLLGIPKLKQLLGVIAGQFYDNPSRKMKVIGVTGTNGKTTTAHLIANSINQAQQSCGLIGTLGYGLFGNMHQLNNTTPDAIQLQKILYDFCNQGVHSVAMEVSSHSLDQYRVAGIEFNTAIFTNLTQDHLDYHPDLAHYANCKKQLMLMPDVQHRIINADDSIGQQWLSELRELGFTPYAYSLQTTNYQDFPTISAHHIQLSNDGIKAGLKTPWGESILHSHFLGRFNLYNLLAAITALCLQGIALSDALTYLSKSNAVPGRLEKLGGNDQPLVIVDYAHTPDALQNVLQTLREHCQGELWCVFGCGGDRDRGKRPLMGAIAEKYADNLIITDDNPRTEDNVQITNGILQGLQNPKAAIIEHDRRRAIAHAISCAQKEDIILIAGKGHEITQQLGETKIPFSDSLEAKLVLENRIERL